MRHSSAHLCLWRLMPNLKQGIVEPTNSPRLPNYSLATEEVSGWMAGPLIFLFKGKGAPTGP
jgi:hypothetical protein